MQQTTKYKFNLIETSDVFSPDALNANARTAETELARVETETAARDAANKSAADTAISALSATHAADKTALEKTITANKTELEKTITANKTELEKTITANKTELEKTITANKSAADTAISALNADVKPGSSGQIARIATGTYVGTGKAGSASAACRLTFGFKPLLVFVCSATDSITHRFIRPGTYSSLSSSYPVIWEEKAVSWYANGNLTAASQCNSSNVTYSYIAIGVPV